MAEILPTIAHMDARLPAHASAQSRPRILEVYSADARYPRHASAQFCSSPPLSSICWDSLPRLTCVFHALPGSELVPWQNYKNPRLPSIALDATNMSDKPIEEVDMLPMSRRSQPALSSPLPIDTNTSVDIQMVDNTPQDGPQA